MKKSIQLTECMFFSQSRRIGIDQIVKRNMQYVTVVGKKPEGKTICVYGHYDHETNSLLDYVNHGSMYDEKGLFEISSIKEIPYRNENFIFCTACYESDAKPTYFMTWPEVLVYKANTPEGKGQLSITGIYVKNGNEMKTLNCSLQDLNENGFTNEGIFYEIY